MKTQTHYTTPIAQAPWVRRGATALAAVLVLAAVSIGLFYALSSLNRTVSAPAASTARQRIASSRVFQDEVLGADQANLAFLTKSAARQRVASSRIFRDEVLGADQANLAFLTDNTAASATRQPSQAAYALAAHQRIASSRVFQDEVLGADQANLAFMMPGATTSGATRQASAPIAARQRIASSRIFQDEMLGAEQLSLAALSSPGSGSLEQPAELRGSGPR